MHIKKIIFINRVPFEQIEINFIEKGVNVLSGINGRGKTTILSYIVDALYELAKPNFRNSFKDKKDSFYRFSSGLFTINKDKPSIVFIEFIDNDGKPLQYLDYRGDFSKEDFKNNIAPLLSDSFLIDLQDIDFSVKNNHCTKTFSTKNPLGQIEPCTRDLFFTNVLTYFPSYRYENPYYLTDPYKLREEFNFDTLFSGNLPNPIEVVSDLHFLANWIMDVVLDWEVSLHATQDKNVKNLPEQKLFQYVCLILQQALYSKKYPGFIRLGIGKRTNPGQRISVVCQRIASKEFSTIMPNIFSLSSGESAVFSMFTEILRQWDRIQATKALESIQGIVLIDEIEKHLHIKLQKEVLPPLFQLFPNVQFIVSSHSPFLNMGLADDKKLKSQIIDLDNNGLVVLPQNTPIYKEVYDLMVNENQRFADKYQKLLENNKDNGKTLVLTEGKTDIQYILKAKEKLEIQDLDFACISPETQPNGCNELEQLLLQLAKVKNSNKIIGIFDTDVPGIVNRYKNPINPLGNNVFAFCIPIPLKRIQSNQTSISLEYYFSDSEIKTSINGKRLFFGSEFDELTSKSKTEDLFLHNQSGRGVDKILESNGGQEVYDLNGVGHLAKKSDFANAVTKNQITISNESWQNFNLIFERIRQIENYDANNI